MKTEDMTAMERFRAEETTIRRDVLESEKYYSKIIREQEKKREAVGAELEKARSILLGMQADFLRLEDEAEAEARERLDAEGKTKTALHEGRVTADEYFRNGLTAAEEKTAAYSAAAEKLADLRDMARAQAVRVLELEAEKAEAEYNIAYAKTAPAAAFREKLKALLEALEKSLSSPLGVSAPGGKCERDAAAQRLQIAKHGPMSGEGTGWKDYDVDGLRRLKLDPTFPVPYLPRLEALLAEAKGNGRGVRLMLDPRERGPEAVKVMWA